VDLYEIGSFMVAEQPGERLITLVREAIDRQALLVFLFHGVGGEHAINVSLNAHRQLLTFLKERQPEIWVAPMIDVVDFLRSVRARPWHPGAQNAARTP
jgi:sialate O-acetylesterase